jgi:hypothetical protein
MNLLKNIVIIIIAVITFTSCSLTPTLLDSGLYKLRKGNTIMSTYESVKADPGFKSASVTELWDLNKRGLEGFGKIEVLIMLKFNPEEYQYYMFAFQDNKLIYWGYPTEFTKSENDLLFKIGKMSVEIIKEELE